VGEPKVIGLIDATTVVVDPDGEDIWMVFVTGTGMSGAVDREMWIDLNREGFSPATPDDAERVAAALAAVAANPPVIDDEEAERIRRRRRTMADLGWDEEGRRRMAEALHRTQPDRYPTVEDALYTDPERPMLGPDIDESPA
jgi:hypothetical protein